MVKKITQNIGFIGAGRMATALASGFVRGGLIAAERIWASDPIEAVRAEFSTSLPNAQVMFENRAVASAVDVLFVAVKPQHLVCALEDVRGVIKEGVLVISIAAGVPISEITACLGKSVRLVRVMPNSPALVGQAACGYSLGSKATTEDGVLVEKLLSAVGKAFVVEEHLLDAVTGLAGSGPAFVYVMIEALSDGGVQMGLSRQAAVVLAAQTVLGAAEMVLQTGQHTGSLKDQVASPGGTTIAGLTALEKGGVRGALMAAVQAATERSVELGRSLKREEA